LEIWKHEVEQIRRATCLPIELKTCSERQWDSLQAECEADGLDIVEKAVIGGEIWSVVIEKKSWPDSARALLPLLLSRPEQHAPLPQQVIGWLQGTLAGTNPAPPARLEQIWSWREQRGCFLLERTRTEGSYDVDLLQQLLTHFFKGASVTLLPLTPVYLLLIVPVTALHNMGEQGALLEWASSLHDLLSTETMEPIRVVTAPPIEKPFMLAEVLKEAVALSHALQRHRPRIMAAATWQFPLERWAASLDASTVSAIREKLAALVPAISLSAEQLETLETFFAQQLNVSETARQLFLHRNTLLYRLDKLTEQTGLDPRRFDDAVLLQLSLLFRQM
jgi:hypothetical protein